MMLRLLLQFQSILLLLNLVHSPQRRIKLLTKHIPLLDSSITLRMHDPENILPLTNLCGPRDLGLLLAIKLHQLLKSQPFKPQLLLYLAILLQQARQFDIRPVELNRQVPCGGARCFPNAVCALFRLRLAITKQQNRSHSLRFNLRMVVFVDMRRFGGGDLGP